MRPKIIVYIEPVSPSGAGYEYEVRIESDRGESMSRGGARTLWGARRKAARRIRQELWWHDPSLRRATPPRKR